MPHRVVREYNLCLPKILNSPLVEYSNFWFKRKKNVFKKLQNYAIMFRETREDEENKEWDIKLQ